MKQLYYVNLLDGSITTERPIHMIGYGYIYTTYDKDLALGICEDMKQQGVENAKAALAEAQLKAAKPCTVIEPPQPEVKKWWKKPKENK